MRTLIALTALAALAACGKADSDPGPGGVTVGEAKALDEAAAILDERRPPADALDPTQSLVPSQSAGDGAAR